VTAPRRNDSAFGHQRERKVAEVLRREGWVVFRSSGSFGVCDLVALQGNPLQPGEDPWARALLVEVKGTARSPWVAWGPQERHELREAAHRAGATPLLVWWPPSGEMQKLWAKDWPVRRPVGEVVSATERAEAS
jgi:Holliday junction resolvase